MSAAEQLVEQAPHPAKWSASVLEQIGAQLAAHRFHPGSRGLDPFAGVGLDKLVQLDDRIEWTGVEIEPEWAVAHERIVVGDATKLDVLFPARTFHVAATSCTYGNRMADTYDGAGKCRTCDGRGVVDIVPTSEMSVDALQSGALVEGTRCPKCDGAGRDKSKRITYRLSLGRMPTPGSTAVMQWGAPYRQMHRLAWRQMHRALRRKGVAIVNVSDHVRGGRIISVADWHRDALLSTGLRLVDDIEIETPRMRFGANHAARVEHERLLVLRKP